MGIKDYSIELNTKNLSFDFDSNDFSDIGYWIRSLKYRFKKKKIYNVHITLNVSYDVRNFDD